MEKQKTTLQGRHRADAYRTTARVVGVVYIAGMVLGVVGNVLILGASDRVSTVAANSTLLAVGALLWLITVAGDAAHGILMFPVLKRHSERIALGYFGARIIDAVLVAVMALLVAFQIPLGREYLRAGIADTSSLQALSTLFIAGQLYAYSFGMLALGLAGLVLCSGLYRARLVPRWLAVWGLVGYAILLCGSVLEVLGFNLRSIHAGPGGLWELFVGVWLIAKGFSASPAPSLQATSPTTVGKTAPATGGVVA